MPKQIPITQLNHLALSVADTARAVAFYRDVLGFREVERPPFDFPGAWLVGYGIQIHMVESSGLADLGDSPNSRGNHYAYAVEDASELVTILEGHGIEYIQRVNAGNVHQTFFQDPDGHTIEVAVYPADPPFLDQ